MLFELSKSLALWQKFIFDVLWKHLNKFWIAYLNNILIYNLNLKEYVKYIWTILAKLREAEILINVDKYEFYIIKIKYLKLIISTNSIKIDLAKVKAICTWSIPISVKEICFFIEFCNFYYRFIQGFFKIANPLNTLTKKEIAKSKL